MTINNLESLKQYTTVVADTGDIDQIRKFLPEDATTNPSLVYKAVQLDAYQAMVAQLKSQHKDINALADNLAVSIGAEIASVVPGRVSTEVDSRLSFDTEATVAKAMELVELYDKRSIDRSRILIKIAATWEGIRAAERLEREGINCNLTLLFSFAQAKACADAGVFLISPFVGRIADWYLARSDKSVFLPEEDPGVASVHRIYKHYKAHNYKTVVMGASFRNVGQIAALTGCDRLTISPALLTQLAATEGVLEPQLQAANAQSEDPKDTLNEASFRWQHNDDAMATEKLAEGIRLFTVDQNKLEILLGE